MSVRKNVYVGVYLVYALYAVLRMEVTVNGGGCSETRCFSTAGALAEAATIGVVTCAVLQHIPVPHIFVLA